MHKFFAIAALFVLCGAIGFNSPKGQQAPKPAPTQTSEGPAVPAEFGLKLRNFQLENERITNGIIQLRAQYDQAYQRQLTNNSMIEQTKKDALKAMNLDPKDWDIDGEKLVAVRKVAPPPAPAAKKSETPQPKQ
jgi:hypothetical protein